MLGDSPSTCGEAEDRISLDLPGVQPQLLAALVAVQKPLVLVHEQQEDKGGGPLEQLRLECHDDGMRAKIFDGRAPIVWHRMYGCHDSNHGFLRAL